MRWWKPVSISHTLGIGDEVWPPSRWPAVAKGLCWCQWEETNWGEVVCNGLSPESTHNLHKALSSGALYIREGIEEKAELKRLFDPSELGSGPLIDPQISENGSLAAWSGTAKLWILNVFGFSPKLQVPQTNQHFRWKPMDFKWGYVLMISSPEASRAGTFFFGAERCPRFALLLGSLIHERELQSWRKVKVSRQTPDPIFPQYPQSV